MTGLVRGASATAYVESVVSCASGCELLLREEGRERVCRLDVPPGPTAAAPPGEALSVILTVESGGHIRCAVVSRRDGTRRVEVSEGLAVLQAGVRGVVRWPQTA